jgi:hypothetical protein
MTNRIIPRLTGSKQAKYVETAEARRAKFGENSTKKDLKRGYLSRLFKPQVYLYAA